MKVFSLTANAVLLIALVFWTALSAGTASAQEAAEQASQTIYKAVGGPTQPKVPVPWNRYHDHQQITDMLKALAEAYPKLAKLESAGKSHEGREMWVITITDFEQGEESRKPGFWIDGGIHANEIQATEVALYTAWFLLEMHGENKFVQDLLRDRVFYILPDMSPDAREAHFYKPNSTNSPRTGLRPVDDDRDGLVDEDPANDLNKDGHITQMRIRDPNGRFKTHKKYSNLMVPVEEGEQGEFTLLGMEGLDTDGDGRINEDGDGSYDPNRDWPWNWQPGYVQGGAFRYPLSLIENRNAAEFVKARPNIAGAQTYHNTGGMLLRGPGSKQDAYESADLRVYDQIGKVGERILPGYRYLNVANDLYEVWGGEIDWFHQMLGVFTFTNELFISYNYFHDNESGAGFFGRGETSYEFDKLMLMGDGLVEWQEIEHPVYGKVEVGGLKKNWGRQPPGFMLQEECHRNMAFTLYHADQMPMVAIREVTSKDLGNGVREVTAIVENKKLTPTHSAVDLKQKITRPDWVSIKGENLTLLTGQYSSDVLMRNASFQEREPATMKIPSVDGNSILYVRWLVTGEGKITVEIDSVKGGRAQTESKLGD
jgi:hypothetical protein